MRFHCYGYGIHLMKRVKTLAKEVYEIPIEAEVHALRVAIKKLNALVTMLAFYRKDLDRHRIKKMRKLFHAAGILREWQLFDQMLSDYHPLHEAVAPCIQKEIQLALIKYRQIYKSTRRSYFKKTGHYLQPFYKEASTLKPEAYFIHLEEEINWTLNNENKSPERFHELRRLLKEFKYNYSAVNELARGAIPPIQDLHFLSKSDKLLGNWHDLRVVVIQLESLAAKDMSDDARTQLHQLKEITGKKADEILNQIIHDMHQLEK